ncbi:MAG TPA: 2-C-methyl-D-erythritol 4-phosphate cytidylyltransferase, partial [Candidatus Saccharimonadales bacterium]|nr:2-C-methyl-D-erythritol 4-phosphate cytidylyltransferase [Candidatus Saccharimonadales bacterium]
MPSSLHGAGVAAIVVAAGRGSRTGLRLPKQFLKVGGRTLLEHAVGRLASHPRIDEIVAVVPAARVASVS